MNSQLAAPRRTTGLKRWWHRHPRLRMFWHGMCNPLYPVPPWSRSEAAEDARRAVLLPLVRKWRRERLIAEYGPVGGWWCPDCGAWIEYGDGKLTRDNFMVHRWCQ